MNIHEYQAKALFKSHRIPVAAGLVVQNQDDLPLAFKTLGKGPFVVKAQIHAGGRGKGHFSDGLEGGGVQLHKGSPEALKAAKAMLGNTLITHQTDASGAPVSAVYIGQAVDIQREYYLAILTDRETHQPVIIASTEGGMDIETLAKNQPEKILRVHIDPSAGIMPHHKRRISFGLGLSEKPQLKAMDELLQGLWELFWQKDCTLVEINPLITTPQGEIIALDAKVNLDENALFRHSELAKLQDSSQNDPREAEALKYNLNYIALNGNIACIVNGAGLAMATMDIIKHYGGSPANFLDVGGSADVAAVTEAFKIVLSEPRVKGILLNIFGGIMNCCTVAEALIKASASIELTLPMVVRLEGNHAAEANRQLQESQLPLTPVPSLAAAAQKIVQLSQGSPKAALAAASS